MLALLLCLALQDKPRPVVAAFDRLWERAQRFALLAVPMDSATPSVASQSAAPRQESAP